MKKNLLEETKTELAHNNIKTIDVKWVGLLMYSPGYHSTADDYPYNTTPDRKMYPFWLTWTEFAGLAGNDYDCSFGGAEIYDNLYVVGADWWLERHEYDGSEWWEFKRLPAKPERHHVPHPGSICRRWRLVR